MFSVDEAQSKAFIADLETKHRATAIVLFNFVTGAIRLPASLLAGVLWTVSQPPVFVTAAVISLAEIVALMVLRPKA